MRVGGLSKIPQKRVEHNRGEGTQRFKKGGSQAGSRGECLKKRGLGIPLRTMAKNNKNTSNSSVYEMTI